MYARLKVPNDDVEAQTLAFVENWQKEHPSQKIRFRGNIFRWSIYPLYMQDGREDGIGETLIDDEFPTRLLQMRPLRDRYVPPGAKGFVKVAKLYEFEKENDAVTFTFFARCLIQMNLSSEEKMAYK